MVEEIEDFVFLLCNRVDDLDKELKVLTATHNALQLEASKKGATLEETMFYLTTLKQDNDKLREVHVQVVIHCLSVCLSVHLLITSLKALSSSGRRCFEMPVVTNFFCLLLQVNNDLKKELSYLRDIVDQHNKPNMKTEVLNKV